MSVARKCVVALVTAVVLLTSARVAEAQDSLNAARDLYAAAAYDEALTALNALAARHEAITESGTVALYRALCLYALGRNADGDRAVEALVAQNPLYPAADGRTGASHAHNRRRHPSADAPGIAPTEIHRSEGRLRSPGLCIGP